MINSTKKPDDVISINAYSLKNDWISKQSPLQHGFSQNYGQKPAL